MMVRADAGMIYRRGRFNPLRGITPAKLSTALDAFDAGHNRAAALLWDAIEDRDDVIQVAAAKRRKAVARCRWQVLQADDSRVARRHRETLEDFFNHIRARDAVDGQCGGGLRLLVRQMMDAAFCGYAAHETVWSAKGGKIRCELVRVPLCFFEGTAGRLRYIGPEANRAEGGELADGGWMVTRGDSALMKALSVCYIFKRLSLQDWLNFSERFGIPGILGKTPAVQGTPDWDRFVAGLEDFSNEWIMAANLGAEVELIEASRGGDAPFAPMVDRMDRRIAALCRGADLSTISRAEGAGASLQGDEGDLLVEDDCELIAETLQQQLARRVIAYQHGEGVEPMAYIRLVPPTHADVRAEIEVDTFLLAHGGELDAAGAYERYGRELPASMPEGAVLKAQPQQAAAPEPGAAPGNGKEPGTKAENDLDPALLRNAVAAALGVVPDWLGPVADLLRELEEKAADGRVDDAELKGFVEDAARRLPELFADLDIAAMAGAIEGAMGASALAGAAETMRKEKP